MHKAKIALAAGVLLGVPLLTAAPAQAANPYTPQDACGSSYSVIGSMAINDGSSKLGTVYVLYSSATGKNCVATIKSAYIGTATYMAADITKNIEVPSDSSHDAGNYKYYAATYLSAAGSCIQYFGEISRTTKAKTTDDNSGIAQSGWGHCG